MMLKNKTILSFMAMIAIAFTQNVFAITVDKIVAFGDSLSDNGNIYALTSKVKKVLPFVPVIPKTPPYHEGRFSNGLNWLDLLAKDMKVPLLDYAYGGSWAEPLKKSGLVFPFSLGSQVDMYMAAHVNDYDQDKHLFILWSGANDYIGDRADHESATTSVVNNIKSQIDWLVYYGGKVFLVPDLPDISIAPKIVAEGPGAVKSAQDIVKLHNQKLMAMLADVKKEYPDVIFVTIDATEKMDDILENPSKYHLKNIKTPCYGGGYWLRGVKADPREVAAAQKAHIDLSKSPSLNIAYMNGKLAEGSVHICANPDEYMFWDQLHPTHAIHKIIARVAGEVLAQHHIHG